MLKYRHKPKAKKRSESIAQPVAKQPRKTSRADVGSLLVTAPFISALLAVYFAFLSIHAFLENRPVAHVGDILAIAIQKTDSSVIPSITARRLATAWAAPGRACSLNIGAIRKVGGSAAVIALRPDGVILEWAGHASATANSDCDFRQPVLIDDGAYSELSGLQTS